MHKFRIRLKQHTPLIHFQGEQEGAILRMTELKPKLDKFLFKKIYKYDLEKYKNYFIGTKEKKALNYKVKVIEYLNRKEKIIDKRFPLFFGNGGESNLKTFVICDSLELEFFSFNSKLIKDIIKYLPEFLMKHNFGTRQSKGFGSFFINDEFKYILNGKKYTYNVYDINNIRKMKYHFSIKINSYYYDNMKQYEKLFSYIEIFYKSMRSRLNRNKKPPFIKKYAHEKLNVTWDKDIINKTYFNKNINNFKEGKLIKDLFGLSTNEKWGNCYIKKEHINKEITRFRSPIFFKPLKTNENEYTVFFEARPIPKEYLNQKFKIKKVNGKNVETKLQLNTPKDFDFDDFFKFIFNEKILKSYFYNKKCKLSKIYQEISDNLKKEE